MKVYIVRFYKVIHLLSFILMFFFTLGGIGWFLGPDKEVELGLQLLAIGWGVMLFVIIIGYIATGKATLLPWKLPKGNDPN